MVKQRRGQLPQIAGATAALICVAGLAFWIGRNENNLRPDRKVCAVPPLDAVKFQPINRAAKALESAVAIGVDQQGFRELLQALATEIAILDERHLTPKEESCLIHFQDAQATYADSLTIWAAKTSPNGLLGGEHLGLKSDGTLANRPWEDKTAPVLILVDDELNQVVTRHNLPRVSRSLQVEYGKLKLRLQAELKLLQFEAIPASERLAYQPPQLLQEGDAERIRSETYILDSAIETLWKAAKAASDHGSRMLN